MLFYRWVSIIMLAVLLLAFGCLTKKYKSCVEVYTEICKRYDADPVKCVERRCHTGTVQIRGDF